ncbi:MAG TPA: hypothetical protein VMZ29_10150 [Candidatus Bathyarchaeia archaeon]|nr:hypothetical protein [Candidatus Bathyarchaeia archaeon]
MKTIALYWGYIIGEEHLTEEQFASIDFGNPNIDTEFITFDPLASSFFQGKYYSMHEKRFAFPHRKLPAMRSETMIIYEETSIKIIDPPVDLNTPAGIFLCIFTGSSGYIKRAIDYLGKRINLRFSPCDFDLEQFYNRLSKTRLQTIPISLTISDLAIDQSLKGNLEVFFDREDLFIKNLISFKPKNCQLKLTIKEVNIQIELIVSIDGIIKFESDIVNLNLLETLFDVASRSVYTGSL